ncbi:MAG: hypothetical protein JWP96_1178 [Polaromonas sp.]|nr:hypothetical protein [Polaromonas sp.]
MNAHIRNRVAALFLLLPMASAVVALPATAIAQPAGPELRSLEVTSDDGLRAGAELDFTVEATPRAKINLRINGVQRPIALSETERGVYTGSYTIKRQDRISPANPIRATLQLRNRRIVTNYSFPAGMANPQMAAPQPVAPLPPVAALRIERFSVAPIDKVEPGAELRFSLNGMPGGTAEVELPGVSRVPLREVRPGVYEGAYTLRRTDNLAPSRPIVASLRVGDQTVKSNLTQGLTADAKPPVLRNLSPKEGEAITDRATIAVSATFDDAGGVGVDPRSVRILLSGRNVTPDSEVTPQFFSYRSDLQPGRHTVDVTAKDMAGNAVHKAWSFDVVVPVGAAPITVPLQITSHANNAIIEGGTTVVRGRTAPGAVVEIRIQAFNPVAGLLGLNQDAMMQRVQADGNGNFSFTVSSQLPLPGTRYEVTMLSRKADLSSESKLVLFQKQG